MPAPRSGTRGRIFVMCYMIGLIDGFDLLSNGLIAPRFAAEFNMRPDQLGLLFGLTSLGLLVGSVGGGRAGDRFGQKAALIGTLLLFGTASLASIVMPDMVSFTVARAVTGIGMGAALPNLLSIVAAHSRADEMARRGTIMASSVPVGGGLVGLLIFLGPADMAWRTVLHVGGWIPVGMALLIIPLLPGTPKSGHHPAGGEAEAAPISALFTQGKAATTLLLWFAFLTMLIISHILINWLPTFFRAMDLSSREGGLAMLTFSAAGIAGSLLFGAALAPRSYHRAALVGYAGTVAGIFGLLLTGQNLTAIILAVAVVSFFQTGAQYMLYGVGPTLYAAGIRGTGSGAAFAAGRLGAAIGPFSAGLILAAGGTAHSVLLAAVPVALASLLAVLAILARHSTAIVEKPRP